MQDLLAKRIADLRKLPFRELAAIVGRPITTEVTVGDKVISVQTLAFWDDRPKQQLRVVVNVDDGGWRAFAPRSDSFIVTSDGIFVGE